MVWRGFLSRARFELSCLRNGVHSELDNLPNFAWHAWDHGCRQLNAHFELHV